MDAAGKIVTWVVGVALVAAYIVMLILQFDEIGASDAEWIRRLELLNPLEALAFAGAGALLGTTVQRQATRQAEQRADANEAAATKGRALEAAVRAKAAKAPETAATIATPDAFTRGLENQLQELVEVAERAPARVQDES